MDIILNSELDIFVQKSTQNLIPDEAEYLSLYQRAFCCESLMSMKKMKYNPPKYIRFEILNMALPKNVDLIPDHAKYLTEYQRIFVYIFLWSTKKYSFIDKHIKFIILNLVLYDNTAYTHLLDNDRSIKLNIRPKQLDDELAKYFENDPRRL